MGAAADFAARRAALSPAARAFRDLGTGRDWTFAEIETEAAALAAEFRRRGIGPGARVAVLCLNRAEMFVALFAARKAGVLACPLNWRAAPSERAEMLARLAPALLVHDSEFSGAAAETGLPLLAMQDGGGFGLPAASLAPVEADEDAPWYLLPTSGTTGEPRLVIQTPRMAVAVAMNLAQAMGLLDSDTGLTCLPLFHTAGLNLFALPLFLWGGQSVILPRFDVDAVAALLAEGHITQMFAVPTAWAALAEHPRFARIDLCALRGLASGGAALPDALARIYLARGAVIRGGYGMTETGPTGFLADARTARANPTSVGQPQLFTEARIAGLADGAAGRGELLVRGATVTPGYWNDAEATNRAFTPDGWLRTGDLAERAADGSYSILDRLKDMYVSGGENVWPAEVERALCAHPQVAEAAVVGVPDPRWGETGVGFVVLSAGATVGAAALRDWLRGRIAGYKVPARIELVPDLPRTAAGKVRKPELRKRLCPAP